MPANDVSDEKKLKEVKCIIRSLLIATSNQRVTALRLNNLYRESEGANIPFRLFGHDNLIEFLNSIPDTCATEVECNQVYVYHKPTADSAHVASLVSRTRKAPPKRSRSVSAFGYNNRARYNAAAGFIPGGPFYSRPPPPSRAPSIGRAVVSVGVLSQVLNEFKLNKTARHNGISKIDILNKVREKCNGKVAYRIEQLNQQLSQFLDLVQIKHDFVYFKEDFASNQKPSNSQSNGTVRVQRSNKEDEINIIEHRTDDYVEYYESYEDVVNKTGMLAEEQNVAPSDRTRFRLQKLIEKHPEGIWCSELPNLYKDEYKIDLEYHDLGFNTALEFVASLTDVFRIVEPGNTNKQMLLDARKPANDFLENNQNVDQPTKTLASQYNFEDYIPSGPDPVPIKLSSKISRTLIPDGVMSLDEAIDQIDVTILKSKDEDYIEVNISEIFTPSFFWITLRKNKKKIKTMMNDLDEFYRGHDLSGYKIPQVVLEPGLNVACVYCKTWHRGIVKKVKPDGFVIILFYDYGTVKTYDPNNLFFLHKRFSLLPAQAIPCALHNVRPIGRTTWDCYSTNKFVKKVWDIPLIAVIAEVDQERNTMMISLTDTSDEDNDVHINDWMVEGALAEYGRMPYIVPPVHKVCMYDEDLLKKLNEEERRQMSYAPAQNPVHNIYQNHNFEQQHNRRDSCVYSANFSSSFTESTCDPSNVATLVKKNIDLTKQTNTIAQAILLNMPIRNKSEPLNNIEDSESVKKEVADPLRKHQSCSISPESEYLQDRLFMDRNSNLDSTVYDRCNSNSSKECIQELNNNNAESNYAQNRYTYQNGIENVESKSSMQSLYSCPTTFDDASAVTPVCSRQNVNEQRFSIPSTYSEFSSTASFELAKDNCINQSQITNQSDSHFKLVFQDFTPCYEIKTTIPKSNKIEIKYPAEFAKMTTGEANSDHSLENKYSYENSNLSPKTNGETDEGYSTSNKHASQSKSDLTASCEILFENYMYSLINLSEKCGRKKIHIFHIDNEGWVCANEFAEAFTNLKDQRVMFRLLEILEFNVNFKQITRLTAPDLFSQLDNSTLSAPREHNKIVSDFILYLLPMRDILKILVKLDFINTKTLKEAASFMKQCKNDVENLMYARYNNKILFDVFKLLKKCRDMKKTLKSSNQ